MTTVNKIPFEALADDDYEKYLDQAKYLQEKGLLLGYDVTQLAKIIYEKDEK